MINNFNKTEAAIFLFRLCFLEAFSFSQLNLTNYNWCLVRVWRLLISPRTISSCSFFVWSQGIMDSMLFTFKEFRLGARWRQWCGIFHNHWWTTYINPKLHSGGIPFSQFGSSNVLAAATEMSSINIYDILSLKTFRKIENLCFR